MKRRSFLKISFGAVVAGSATGSFLMGPFRAGAQEKKPVKIGLLAPLTGVSAHYGPILLNSATVAVEEINEKGGILGRKVEFILEDDKFDPPAAAERAKKLIGLDKVDAIIGTISSATTNAVIPLAQRAKTPFIYVIMGEDKACHEYVFGLGPTPYQQMVGFAPFMVENLGKRFYFVGSDYVFPRQLNAETIKIIKQKGGEVIGEEYASFGTTDWSTLITRVEAAKPDVFFVSAVGSDTIALIKQAVDFGLKKKMKLVAVPGYTSAYLPALGAVGEGDYTVVAYDENIDNPVNKEFTRRYKEKYKPKFPIVEVGNTTYAAFHVVKKAAEKAGSLDGDKLRKSIEGLTIQAPQGEMYISPGNHLTKQPMYIARLEGGRYKIVKNLGIIEEPDKCDKF